MFSAWANKEKGEILMKKLIALLLALSFALMLPVLSSAQPEMLETTAARAATHSVSYTHLTLPTTPYV